MKRPSPEYINVPPKIPPGYMPLSEYANDHPEIHYVDDIQEPIRWLNQSIGFVFDPNNIEYLEFLANCREDTKALAAALHLEFAQRGLSVWVKRSRKPAAKKNYRDINFLIRPPFFSSREEKNENNRMQDSDEDNFVMHFDEDAELQVVRNWKPSPKTEKATNISAFRKFVAGHMEENHQFFKEHYGDWQAFAVRVADIVAEALPMLDYPVPF